MSNFENIKVESSLGSQEEPKRNEDFSKINIPPEEIENLGNELEKETGISLGILEKLGKIPRLRQALAILLLSSGLGFTVLEDAFSQKINNKDGTEQIDPQVSKTSETEAGEEELGETKEKLNEIKKEFVDFIKGLQEKNIVEYNHGEERGMEEATFGKIGKYDIQVLFHHYPHGAEKGKVTGGENERIGVTYTDENGSSYCIESSFGNFHGHAFNYEEREGFRKLSSEEFITKYGIVLGRMDKEGKPFKFAYIKDLSPKEIENIISDVNEQAETK